MFLGMNLKKKKPKGNTSFVAPIFCTKFGPLHLPVSSLKINTKLRLWFQHGLFWWKSCCQAGGSRRLLVILPDLLDP